MKNIKRYIAACLSLLIWNGCSTFDDVNTNPDTPNFSTAAMQATGQLVDLLYYSKGGNKYYVYDCFVSKQMAWGEAMETYQYNRFGRRELSEYVRLTNCNKMVELAEEIDKDPYTGLALFIKAITLFKVSLDVGDIPYQDAVQGEEGVTKPRFDTQKEVMKQILEDLDEAYNCFSRTNRSFEGDIVYGGDPEKWKKTITALQLKVLMYLSKKESDSDLNIRTRFASLVSQRPLYTSNADNFQLVYGLKQSQICPLHNTKTKHMPYAMLSTVVIDSLKKYNDYRLFYYGKPSETKLAEGLAADDWNAYPAVDPSLSFDLVGAYFSNNDYTGLNNRYTEREEAEPLIVLGYSEQNFLLAEACLRNWISGDANDYYKKGIEASMRFILENTPDEEQYNHGRPMTDSYIAEYLSNPELQLATTNVSFENDLNKLMTMKYLSSFIQYPWDAYYDYRRTGYPVLPIDPSTNLNSDPNKLPMRWMYDQREYDYNNENVLEAVARQFNGNDDVNELMWILK